MANFVRVSGKTYEVWINIEKIISIRKVGEMYRINREDGNSLDINEEDFKRILKFADEE